MLWLLEKGMVLNQNKHWFLRIIGNMLMLLPILKAKHIERRVMGDLGYDGELCGFDTYMNMK